MSSRITIRDEVEPVRRPRHPDRWYPSGEREIRSRVVVLHGGEQVRTVECGASDARPVVLIHGWGCSVYLFHRVLAALGGRGLRAIAIDVRGHGLSDKPAADESYEAPELARFLVATMDAIGLTTAIVVGHSMGAGIALDVAASSPGRISGLVLCCPVGLVPVRFVGAARLLTPSVLVPGSLPRWVVALVLRSVYGEIASYDDRDIEEYWAPTQFPEFIRAMRTLLHTYDWRPRPPELLARLPMPVRVLLGTSDPLIDVRHAQAAARAMSHAALRIIPGGGHVLPAEAPDVLVSEVLALSAELR